MRHFLSLLITSLLFSPLTLADDGPDYFMAALEPLNDSGVVGVAMLTVEDGKSLTVRIDATGLEPLVIELEESTADIPFELALEQ